MSRSRRRPYITDQQRDSGNIVKKRHANRAVRQADEVSDGKQYRKLHSSYDIRDYSFHCPKDKKAYRK